MEQIDEIIVIGSGNWGLALACLFSGNRATRVWTIDAETAEALQANRENPGSFYPFPIPDSVRIEEKYAGGFQEDRTLFIVAVPSSQMSLVARELSQYAQRPLVLSVSKGFSSEHMCTMSALIKRELPGAIVQVLTGPTIAREVASGQPTRAALAGEDLRHLALVKDALRNDIISFEVGRNPEDHEICGALKGLVAIAVGICDGLDLGANMQGIIMTEGIRELAVVGSFFGITGDVAFGVSGAGDLITTCISRNSRNRLLGRHLAHGLTLEQALDAVGMTVEGVAMSKTIETLWALDLSIPLIHFVDAAVAGQIDDLGEDLHRIVRAL